MNKIELNKFANRELYKLKKHYNNETVIDYLQNNVYGIDFENMTLDLSSYSYADLYKEKIIVSSFSKRVTRTIPTEICTYFRSLLTDLNQK
ncbi:hypothetical protein [Sulfurimonas sp.]|uniref:hypothetical protein n=1 Tax=Sulfurimonas sp. TaxID=2022749 RepID=UPI003D135BAB